jgi:hypothetical protein
VYNSWVQIEYAAVVEVKAMRLAPLSLPGTGAVAIDDAELLHSMDGSNWEVGVGDGAAGAGGAGGAGAACWCL